MSEAITFVLLVFGYWTFLNHVFVSVPSAPLVAAFIVLFGLMYAVQLSFVLEIQKKAAELKCDKRTNTTCIESVFIIASIISFGTIIVLVVCYAMMHMNPPPNEGVKRNIATTLFLAKILFYVFVPPWAGMVPSMCRILAIKKRIERDDAERAKAMDAAYAFERAEFVRERLNQIYKELVVARQYTLASVDFDFDPEAARSVGLVPEGSFVRLVEKKACV